MSTGRSNAMDALPRASFLAYFRTSNNSKPRTSGYHERPPPPYRKHYSQAPHLPRIPEDESAVEDIDEEWQVRAFDNDFDTNEDNYEEDEENAHEWNYWDVLSLLGYTLLVMFVVLDLDFLLSSVNANTGLVNWNTYDPGAGASIHEMHFCLVEQSRSAPTSRVWRYVPNGSDSDCRTRAMTIRADANEIHELFSEDIITVEAAMEVIRDVNEGRSIGKSSAKSKYFEGDDDLAKEGSLRQEGYTGS